MEGIKRYDAMRAAFRALTAGDEMEARKALEAEDIIGFSESLQINSALSVVRRFLAKLDEWERQQKAA